MFIIVGFGAAAAACLDVTPITDVPAAADAGAADVTVAPEVAKTACFQCTSGASEVGPNCRAEYATCGADPKCLALFLCGIPRGCYVAGADLVKCLTACGIAAGLTGADDPAVAPFLALDTCATTSCTTACASKQ